MTIASTHIKLKLAALAFALTAGFSQSAHAQAEPTGSLPLSIAAYAGVSQVAPDYGPTNDLGFLVGATATRNLRFVQPALDARFGYATGDTVNQSYFLGNLRFAKALGPQRRFRPNVAGGVGYGKITYKGSGYADNSIVYDYIAGLDYVINTRFTAKAEYQQQFWDLGQLSNGLTPRVITLGLAYRLHLRH